MNVKKEAELHKHMPQKESKLHTVGNNQIWNNKKKKKKKKQLLFVCIIIRDNIGFEKIFKR